jgi:hypothetical protein
LNKENTIDTNAGLNNNGRTQYFEFMYDDSLTSSRGKELANDLMNFCDQDFLLVSSWFTGVSVGTPINVKISNISSVIEGGASWWPSSLSPLEITLKLGEFQVPNTTPTILLRYLMVSEISEIFMRDRQSSVFHLFNDWFEASNEGSKGEALSRFLGVQFLINEFRGCNDIPRIEDRLFNVSHIWLNSARDNYIDDNQDDIHPDVVTGCATLFLFYLHDQLGYSINDIINAGGRTLSDVYSNLTGSSRDNAWNSFINLVNLHCPQDGTLYTPPCDNIFPVSDLDSFTAPIPEVSWVTNGNFKHVGLFLNHATTVDIQINLTSDIPTLINIQPNTDTSIHSNNTFTYVDLNVLPQPSTYKSTSVTLTASYAGKLLSNSINVVAPENLTLPLLEIIPKMIANDPCRRPFIEGSSQDFIIKNLDIIYDHTGLVYHWSVNGAVININNSEVLSIPNLPVAGTKVIINVTVTNAYKIHAKGTLEFTVNHKATGLAEQIRELDCLLRNIKNMNIYIPPWVPIEDVELDKERLVRLEKQSRQIILGAKKVIATINKIKSSKIST